MDIATFYDLLITVMTVITFIVVVLIFLHMLYGKEETAVSETK